MGWPLLFIVFWMVRDTRVPACIVSPIAMGSDTERQIDNHEAPPHYNDTVHLIFTHRYFP